VFNAVILYNFSHKGPSHEANNVNSDQLFDLTKPKKFEKCISIRPYFAATHSVMLPPDAKPDVVDLEKGAAGGLKYHQVHLCGHVVEDANAFARLGS
jgi:hypothetical protein